MALPVYPAINYLHELGSVTLNLSDGKSRASTDMDSGPARNRRRFSSVQSSISLKVLLSDEEFQQFKSFYKETLQDGTLWFVMPIFEGSQYLPHTVRFNPASSPQMQGAGFKQVVVSYDLVVRDLYAISLTTYYLMSLYGGDLSQYMIDAADRFVNICYPAFADKVANP